MKHIILCSFLLPLAALEGADQTAKPVMRDAATHQQIVRTLQRAEQNDPMKVLIPDTSEDPSKVNQPVDLLAQSDILSFNGLATLVPKQAILARPANHLDRLQFQPGDRIVGWTEFYAQNHNWITTVEVTRRQAEGNALISQETLEAIGKSRNLVVATCLGGPISVLPPKETSGNAETSTPKP